MRVTVADSLLGFEETITDLQNGQTPVEGFDGAPQLLQIISKLMTTSLHSLNRIDQLVEPGDRRPNKSYYQCRANVELG